MPRDVVVLFSGGLDSTVCAEMARRSGALHTLLHFQYGQANAEMEMVTSGKWATARGLSRLILPMPIRAAELHIGSGVEGPRVVPGRNFAMLATAANYAASVGCREVWIGCNADDAADYPDCRDTFLRAVSDLTRYAAGVDVVAPLLGETKAGVVRLAHNLGLDLAETWSCYEPTRAGNPCGGCNACRLRAAAETALQSTIGPAAVSDTTPGRAGEPGANGGTPR